MSKAYTILVLEDEPLILMDLEFAAVDRGCTVKSAMTCEEAFVALSSEDTIDVAVLDVSLGAGCNCAPVADELVRRKIPYILHSGDLDRHAERVRELDAPLIAKPASADKVIAAAIVCSEGKDPQSAEIAAE